MAKAKFRCRYQDTTFYLITSNIDRREVSIEAQVIDHDQALAVAHTNTDFSGNDIRTAINDLLDSERQQYLSWCQLNKHLDIDLLPARPQVENVRFI